MDSLETLSPFDVETDELQVVIDTPKGSRNRFSWDEKKKLFKLSGVLPAGAIFPYDFGFIPQTKGEDGDALDVLILMDEPAFTGCLVPARLLGVIAAKQTEKGKTFRNDRLLAVATGSHTHDHLRSIAQIERKVLDQIEHFFVSYNAAKGKKFTPLGRFGPARARALVRRATK
ncbi:MAG TPA: inorganic diphosphatase [Chthoniobacterales bacterium]|jgi:inorganic pyrophosphatase